MASSPWFVTFAISFLAYFHVTQATSFEDQVDSANIIIHDLPGYLAYPYCSDQVPKPTQTATASSSPDTLATSFPPFDGEIAVSTSNMDLTLLNIS